MKTFVTTRRPSSPLTRILFAVVLALGLTSASQANSVFVSVAIAPPAIPVYAQPICPGPGYVWVPGYWAYEADDGYYWVPGYWVLPPFIGALWTPGYWGWAGGLYVWHAGYWGPHVGFYGGINYGFGYFGVGYTGGYWRGSSFYYNTAVTNVNVTTVNHVYTQRVTEATTTRVSFNGGPGGISAQPTAQERIAQREAHRSATPIQVQHQNLARADRSQWASVNHGSPSVTATPRAAAFGERGAGQRAPSPGAAAPPQRESRAQFGRPETNARIAPGVNREARIEQRAVQPSSPPPNREARVEHRAPPPTAAPMARPETHANVAPRTEMRAAPRPETHAQAAPRQEFRPQAAPRPERQAVAPRPETHSFNAPRSDMRTQAAPRAEMHAQAAPRPEMRAQAAPRAERAQAAPRAEIHAQAAPRQAPAGPQRESRGGPGEHRPGGDNRG